jgi:putative methyltransferase (TIGR04325 family)
MFLQERAREINEKLSILANRSNIVVWAAGVHTSKLFERTELLSYDIKNIVDMNADKEGEFYFGFKIKNPEKMDWSNVGAVVISVPAQEKKVASLLRDELKYTGLIITLYEENKCTPFYLLYDERSPGIRYLGDYNSWTEAAEECEGYDDSVIINKAIWASQKVLNGEAKWERDSFLFYEQKYVYKLCASILRCALKNGNKGVRVLDLGGSLGSTYFQNIKYLEDVNNLEYIVAEQDHYRDYGHEHLENSILKFISSKDDWESQEKYDIILMSASLQYISEYIEITEKIKRARPEYIILDRILISERGRLCKETVPEKIYKSSYPVRIFSEKEIKDFFEPEYQVIENDISSVPETANFIDGKAESRFYVFQNQVSE